MAKMTGCSAFIIAQLHRFRDAGDGRVRCLNSSGGRHVRTPHQLPSVPRQPSELMTLDFPTKRELRTIISTRR